jgi:hypothetical protein
MGNFSSNLAKGFFNLQHSYEKDMSTKYHIIDRPSQPLGCNKDQHLVNGGCAVYKDTPTSTVLKLERGMYCDYKEEQLFGDENAGSHECKTGPFSSKGKSCPDNYSYVANPTGGDMNCTRPAYKPRKKCPPESVEYFDDCYQAIGNGSIHSKNRYNIYRSKNNTYLRESDIMNAEPFNCDIKELEYNNQCYGDCESGYDAYDITKCRRPI